MKLSKIISNAVGIGLVEVMMGVAISGGLALTIAKMMENANQNTKQNEAKNEGINLKGIVSNILSNPTACTYTVGPLINSGNLTTLAANSNNSIAVPNIKDKNNTVVYSTTVAATVINPLKIKSIVLTNYNSGLSSADLVINTTFQRSSSTVQDVKPLRITLSLNITGTTLTACSLQSSGGEWLLSGNAGTDPASDYIGTSDNQPLIFKINSINSGRIDSSGAFFGFQSGTSNTGANNAAFGVQSLFANTSGQRNTSIGYQSLNQNTTGNDNISLGYQTLKANTTGTQNIAVGQNSMGLNTTASYNIAVGMSSLYANTTGTNNVAIGHQAQRYNQTGVENVGIGYAAIYGNVGGSQNTAMGQYAGNSIRDGNYNTAIGWRTIMQSMYGTNNGSYNTAIGAQALINTYGGYNTSVGGHAGAYNIGGEYNTYLGYRTGAWAANMSGSRNIFIGAFAGNSSAGTNYATVTTDSDKLYVNNGATTTPLIYGDFSSTGRFVKFDGNISIGMANTLSATTKRNLVVGNNNTLGASSTGAVVAGDSNTVNSLSYAFGNSNNVQGWNAMAIGQGNNITNGTCYIMGWNNNCSGQKSNIFGSANNVTADYAIAMGTNATAGHSGSFVIGDYGGGVSSDTGNQFAAKFRGGYKFYTGSGIGASLAANATSWGVLSDKNSKENFEEIDLEEHLRKIANMPVSKWNYKGKEQKKIKHMGPMAQDFYYIFKLGDGNDKVITTQDMEGVTIVAVKGLEERTRKLQKENEELKKRNNDLEERLNKLERLVEEKIGPK